MVKRTMGKRIFREPIGEQAAKYRQVREAIAADIMEIKHEARALRCDQPTKTKSLPPSVGDSEVNDG